MTLPQIEYRDVPPDWKGVIGFIKFAIFIIAIVGAVGGFVRYEARAEARAFLDDGFVRSMRAEAIDAAQTAASMAVDKAIRETIAPVALDVARHRAEDDARVNAIQKDLDALKWNERKEKH